RGSARRGGTGRDRGAGLDERKRRERDRPACRAQKRASIEARGVHGGLLPGQSEASGGESYGNFVVVAFEDRRQVTFWRNDVQRPPAIRVGISGAVWLDTFFEIARHVQKAASGGDDRDVGGAQVFA